MLSAAIGKGESRRHNFYFVKRCGLGYGVLKMVFLLLPKPRPPHYGRKNGIVYNQLCTNAIKF